MTAFARVRVLLPAGDGGQPFTVYGVYERYADPVAVSRRPVVRPMPHQPAPATGAGVRAGALPGVRVVGVNLSSRAPVLASGRPSEFAGCVPMPDAPILVRGRRVSGSWGGRRPIVGRRITASIIQRAKAA